MIFLNIWERLFGVINQLLIIINLHTILYTWLKKSTPPIKVNITRKHTKILKFYILIQLFIFVLNIQRNRNVNGEIKRLYLRLIIQRLVQSLFIHFFQYKIIPIVLSLIIKHIKIDILVLFELYIIQREVFSELIIIVVKSLILLVQEDLIVHHVIKDHIYKIIIILSLLNIYH